MKDSTNLFEVKTGLEIPKKMHLRFPMQMLTHSRLLILTR
jgi:hypothetical protein